MLDAPLEDVLKKTHSLVGIVAGLPHCKLDSLGMSYLKIELFYLQHLFERRGEQNQYLRKSSIESPGKDI